jgi:hypothetical protein
VRLAKLEMPEGLGNIKRWQNADVCAAERSRLMRPEIRNKILQ